jgi:hypothetical protein
MQVSTVTDIDLERFIRHAASPLVVLFADGDPDRLWLIRRRMVVVEEEYLQLAIFVQISVDENPTPARLWTRRTGEPEIVVFWGRTVRARLHGEFTAVEIGKIVEAVRADRYRR